MIEIREVCVYREGERGNLRGLASVKVGSAIIHEWRVVQVPGQRAFVQPPQRTWVDGQGKTHFRGPLVELPLNVLETVKDKVMAAWLEQVNI